MFKRSELRTLINTMRASGVVTLEIKNNSQSLRLVLPVNTCGPEQLTEQGATLTLKDSIEPVTTPAKSPTIGVFLSRGIDDGLAPVEPGMSVAAGEILGYVCRGLVRVMVSAPLSGVLSEQGPQDGTALGVGDTVFILEVVA